MSGLFNVGDFTLHSGKPSSWKIDCDSLSDGDITALAAMLADVLPYFAAVEGVPTGGLRLAEAMKEHAKPSMSQRLLIVDDVLTTGDSINRQRCGRDAIGAVIFSRGPCPDWVISLWSFWTWTS